MTAPIVSLKKNEPAELTNTDVVFRINWALATHVKSRFGRKPSLDLDASAVGLDSNGDVIAFCFHGFRDAAQGTMHHFGDTKAKGGGDWANEAIGVKLPELPADIASVVFVLNSYGKADFGNLGEAFAEVLVGDNVIARASLSLISGSNAYAVVAFYRNGSGWSMTSLNHGGNIGHDDDAVKQFASQSTQAVRRI